MNGKLLIMAASSFKAIIFSAPTNLDKLVQKIVYFHSPIFITASYTTTFCSTTDGYVRLTKRNTQINPRKKTACLSNVKDPKGETRFQVRVKMAFAVTSMARAQYLVTAFTISNKILYPLKTCKTVRKTTSILCYYTFTYSYTTFQVDLNWQIAISKLIQLCCDADANNAAVM